MTRPSNRQMASAVWANRPSAPELLFLTVAVAISHWALGLPVPVLALVVFLILAGGTMHMALSDLRKAGAVECIDPPEKGGHDAD
ncbi:hypothetical protein ACQP2T_13480 [Nonomuraea sp. CA-143628]|uniref:hypothetical protein n=1 Tax=Nonomuraea sp. CA-143628 TaxID=3239997 RepID=UPI003D8C19E6